MRRLASSFGLVRRADPRLFWIAVGLQLGTALGALGQVLAIKYFLDVVFNNGSAGLWRLAPPLLVLMVATQFVSAASALTTEIQRPLSEKVARRASLDVLEAATATDLLAFESPAFFDRLSRADLGIDVRPYQLVSGLLALVGGGAGVLALICALGLIAPLAIPIALLAFLPLRYATRLNAEDFYAFSIGLTARDRLRRWLMQLLVDRSAAKEVRAFNLGEFLLARVASLFDERLQALADVVRRRMRRLALAMAVSTCAMTAALLGLGYLYTSGRTNAAALTTVIVALIQLLSRLGSLSLAASALQESALFVEDYEAFSRRAASDRFGESVAIPRQLTRLEADGLTFRYPGTDVAAVADVSLELTAGEIVAIVGENGSGKTTLAKLLGGLYAPQRGRILWDGVDTRSWPPTALPGGTAVIFQDFVRYLLSVRENIGIAHPDQVADTAGITRAAQAAGADGAIRALRAGYDTILSPQFDAGVDLSAGQWQRIALARAFFRDAPLLILDEPTASLDPRAESELVATLRSLLAGRTALVISHRLATVRAADRVLVMQAGRIVEEGTHDELIAHGGHYAELHDLQAHSAAATTAP